MLIPINKTIRETKIEMALDVYIILRDILYSKHKFDQEKEHFYTVIISRNNRIKYIDEVSIGNLTSTIVTPREVFRFAILKGAEAIIIAHNHPSGNLTPSPQDKAMTKKIEEAGEIIGIALLDSLIITPKSFYSFLGTRLLKPNKPNEIIH